LRKGRASWEVIGDEYEYLFSFRGISYSLSARIKGYRSSVLLIFAVLRFSDDVLIVVNQRRQHKKMMGC